MNDELLFLQSWYAKHCDGKWEHGNGIKIETLDNPGWWVEIELAGTELETKVFKKTSFERSPGDWMRCWTEKSKYRIACSPNNLGAGLKAFMDWVNKPAS